MNKLNLKGRLGNILLADKGRFRTIVEWDTENFNDFVSFMNASEYSSFEIYDTIKYEIFQRSGYRTFRFFDKELFEKMFRTSVDNIYSERKYFEILNLCGVTSEEIDTLDIDYHLAVRVDYSDSFMNFSNAALYCIREVCDSGVNIYRILYYLLFYHDIIGRDEFIKLLESLIFKVVTDGVDVDDKVNVIFVMETIIEGKISMKLYTHFMLVDSNVFSIISLAQLMKVLVMEG